ncbi:hypothetical protein AgCh_002752 [Apium graveolens]
MSAFWKEIEAMHTLPTVTTITDDGIALLKAIEYLKEETRLFQFLNVIQQEESQKDVLTSAATPDLEMAVMSSKCATDKGVYRCSNCGGRGRSNDKCWNIIEYPPWHHKYNAEQHKKPNPKMQNKWSTNKFSNNKFSDTKRANVAIGSCDQNVALTTQQLEQLLNHNNKAKILKKNWTVFSLKWLGMKCHY